jgi:hypothetical protein
VKYCSECVVKHRELGEGHNKAPTPQRGHCQLQQPVPQLSPGYPWGAPCLRWSEFEAYENTRPTRPEDLPECGIACRTKQ